jgi:alpha-ribazole phosphatase
MTPDLSPQAELTLHLWRHPRAAGAAGRCIGITDLPVDPRKAKRLAHRIRQQARRQGWPREVHSSPLQRCAHVGRILRSWGWRHHVHPDWRELDFGAWEGRRWTDIARTEVDAWAADFARHAPGQGESLQAMTQRLVAHLDRLAAMAHLANLPQRPASSAPGAPGAPVAPTSAPPIVLVVAHAGVMQILNACQQAGRVPAPDDAMSGLRAADWPAPPRHLSASHLCWPPQPPLSRQ